jgi:uncharacterized protein (TIGR03663 family)
MKKSVHAGSVAVGSQDKFDWVSFFIVLTALMFRLWALGEKPAHFDEGVNGWFLDRMFEKFAYRYDPENYHGPLHFYITIPFVAVLGSTETALRLPAVLFAVATTWLLTRYQVLVGRLPALLAALIFAVSPGAMFYSRYGIHEAGLAFFVTLFGLSLMMLWKEGLAKWLFLLIASIAAAMATKETFFMNLAPLPIAAGCIWLLAAVLRFPAAGLPPMSHQRWEWRDCAIAVLLAAVVLEILYSGFGDLRQDWGLGKFAEAYGEWSKTAEAGAGHKKPDFDLWGGFINYYWLYLLWIYEWPMLVGLALAGLCWVGIGPWARLAAVWSVGILMAYSLVPYKTPWCILSMLPPICLAAGAALYRAAFVMTGSSRPALGLAALLSISTIPRSFVLNYGDYDLPSEPYVYVQTHRESKIFLDELRAAFAQDPRVADLRGSVALDSYYPLPWWLNKHSRLEYIKGGTLPSGEGKAWVLVPWARKDEFLAANRGTPWRVARFKLRDAQEDVAAILNQNIFPEPGKFVFPE